VDGVDGACLCHAQPMFDLGEDLLDRIEVRRVGRQEREPGAGRKDRGPYRPGTMAAEVVEDDNVAGTQLGHQELLDIGAEDSAIDRAIDDARRGERIGLSAARNVSVRQRPSGAKPFSLWPLMPSRGSVPCWS
jgi:hypothetical protein